MASEIAVGDVTDVVSRTEVRLARMAMYIRAGSVVFVYIPIFGWGRLAHPLVALVTALAATAEAGWFVARVQGQGRDIRDQTFARVDVLFCIALMLVGSRAAFPHERNVMTTELLPFSLVSPACVGFTYEFRAGAMAAVGALMAAWTSAVYPDVSLKLGSDLFGFAFWYVITTLTARELRTLSRATAAAQQEAARIQQLVAEREMEAAVARQRERAHLAIHDHLLPIVDHVASGAPAEGWIVRQALGEAARARRLIIDPRAGHVPGFEAQLIELCDTYSQAGLTVAPVFAVRGDPPGDVAEGILSATGEALRNVLRHAGPKRDVNLFAESSPESVEITVRDYGVGFDPDTVKPGGGLGGTYMSIGSLGGEWEVWSRPGEGTKITLRWPRASAPSGPAE